MEIFQTSTSFTLNVSKPPPCDEHGTGGNFSKLTLAALHRRQTSSDATLYKLFPPGPGVGLCKYLIRVFVLPKKLTTTLQYVLSVAAYNYELRYAGHVPRWITSPKPFFFQPRFGTQLGLFYPRPELMITICIGNLILKTTSYNGRVIYSNNAINRESSGRNLTKLYWKTFCLTWMMRDTIINCFGTFRRARTRGICHSKEAHSKCGWFV